MRVDFYQLGGVPAEQALALLAGRVISAGQRMLVVSADEAQLGRIDKALWAAGPTSFLAHGRAGGENDASQPILLSGTPEPANGATVVALADGVWREAPATITRSLLLFDSATIDDARACWRMLGDRTSVERRYWKQQGGRWVEGP